MLHKSKYHCNERQSPNTTIHAYLTMYCPPRYASWVGAPSHHNSVHDSHALNVHIGISSHDGTWICWRWQRDYNT